MLILIPPATVWAIPLPIKQPSRCRIKGVAELDFGDFEDNHIDLFGDAYEFLISNYAANAGKSGGEFFTPQCVSKLIARLALYGQDKVNKIYDPAAGSGSLLLQAKNNLMNTSLKKDSSGRKLITPLITLPV